MKFPSTYLSLIIGAFLVTGSKGQVPRPLDENFSAVITFDVQDGPFLSSTYVLSCNTPDQKGNHPWTTLACDELSEIITAATGNQISPARALYEALAPLEFTSTPSECGTDGVYLRIVSGTVNDDPTNIVRDAETEQISLIYDYRNICELKSIEEKGGLAHFVPFNDAGMIEPPAFM